MPVLEIRNAVFRPVARYFTEIRRTVAQLKSSSCGTSDPEIALPIIGSTYVFVFASVLQFGCGQGAAHTCGRSALRRTKMQMSDALRLLPLQVGRRS